MTVTRRTSGGVAAGGTTARDDRRILRRATIALSVAVAVLVFAASLAGLLLDDVYGRPAATAEMLRAYDLVALALAPALVLSVFRATRGSDRAWLAWAGLLAYLTYTAAFYVFGSSFNDLFLLHVAVFGGSAFALVLTMSAMDVAGISSRFAARTPRRLVGGILGLLAVALGAMWVYATVRSSITGDVPAGSALVEPDLVVHLGIALDLALLVPAYAAAAVLLWRGVAWGYAIAAIVLVAGLLHQISYLVAMPLQVAADIPGAVAFDPFEPVIVLFYLIAAAVLLWHANGEPRPSAEPGVRR